MIFTSKKAIAAIVFAAMIFGCAFKSNAALLLIQTNALTGTANSGIYSNSTTYLSSQTFLVSSLGITNAAAPQTNIVSGVTNIVNLITNAILVNFQYSIDPANSNWVTYSSWNPNSTNVESDTVTISGAQPITLYFRAQMVTTNSLSGSTFKTP